MSTLKLENIKHENSSTNNMVMDSDGSVSTTGNATVGGTLGITGDLTVDTNTLKVDAANNRLGIGTATPSKVLDITQSTSDDNANVKLTYAGGDGNRSGFILNNTHTGGREYGIYAGNNSTGGGLGNSLGISDNTAGTAYRLLINSSGEVTKPSQPHMLAMGYKERYGTTDRHLFQTVTTNTGNHWNNTNGKFTCPVAGTYLVTAFSGYKQADDYAGIGIGYNGSALAYGWSHPTDDRHGHQNVTIMHNASANDYFYYIAHTSYTTPISSTGNNHHAHFSVYLLG